MIKSCHFCDNCLTSILCDQIVLRIWKSQTEAELLIIRELELQRYINICKLMENAAQQCQVIIVTTKMQKNPLRKSKLRKDYRFCTSFHEPGWEQCWAYGKMCLKCWGKKLVQTWWQGKDRYSNQLDFEHIDTVMTEGKVDSLVHGTI